MYGAWVSYYTLFYAEGKFSLQHIADFDFIFSASVTRALYALQQLINITYACLGSLSAILICCRCLL